MTVRRLRRWLLAALTLLSLACLVPSRWPACSMQMRPQSIADASHQRPPAERR